MMVDEELRDDEVEGNEDAMDVECELYSCLKTLMRWSDGMLISIAANSAGGPLPSQDDGLHGNMPRDSTNGMLFLDYGRYKSQ
jgi:hypothetical protein